MVRSDLSPGDQACQAIHAAVDWCMSNKLSFKWHKSNYIVLLQTPNEDSLLDEISRLQDHGYSPTLIQEPDLSNEVTAFAVEPAAGYLLSSLPLAFKEVSLV